MSTVTVEDLAANLLLASLAAGEQESLVSSLRHVHFALGDQVFAAGQELRSVLFPTSGVISLLAGTGSGSQVEVSTVGREGMVGLPLLFGGRDSGNLRAVCQMPADSLLASAADFSRWLRGQPGRLPQVMEAYARLQFIVAAQAVVCSRLHQLDERCARWLLLTHDRAETDEFPITHEFLAQMLGVRRASVTLAARRLRKRRVIEYRRGQVRVLDRARLEEAACECYAVVRTAREQLIPTPRSWSWAP